MLDPRAVHAERLGHLGEVGVGEVGAEGDEAGGLHLELDEAERAVVEHDELHRQAAVAGG